MLTIVAESALRSLVLGSVVWAALNLLRVRNPHLQMTSWVIVLVASLSMPLLMHWTTLTITLEPAPQPALENLWPAGIALPEPLRASTPAEFGIPGVARGAMHQAFNWWALATAIYALVAGMLLLRLALGIYLTWRLARSAPPVGDRWAAAANVRVSDVIGGPVTFGSTILLPPQYVEWDLQKRQAVLAHEGAHVANRDSYVLLLASLNRAVFWFSPFAWWQFIRLAELAEIISDAEAVEVLEDRLSYAEILLDLVQHGPQTQAGLEMARACTVRARVERILAASTAPAKAGWRRRIWTAAVIAPVVVASAGSIAYRAPVTTLAIDGAGDATTAMRRPQQVDFFSLGPASIFAVSREGDELFGQLTWQRKLRLAKALDGTYSYPGAPGQITLSVSDERQPPEVTLSQNGHDRRAVRLAEIAWQGSEADAGPLESYVGWYELSQSRVLSVTRDGNRLYAQETGRPKFEVAAHSADAFAGNNDDLAIFLRDGEARVTKVLLHEPMSGARLAPRVDAAKAGMIEQEFARRIAEVPDRFKEQVPLAGSREAILRGIDDLQRGAPNYERMSASLAGRIHEHVSELHAMLKAFGAVESIFFRGVGPGGYDIYGVKFANGSAEFRIQLAADGKADDVLFRPDGNDALGGVAACSDEQALRSRGDTAPIKLTIYNGSGSDIRLYSLDSEGKRSAHGSIGDDMSSSIVTEVESPWVIADASGKCLEIVLPGQRTRFHAVEGSRADGQPEHAAPPRTAPLAGSEQTLRQYIEALGRGEPNYDRMTPEVAAWTRQQLALNRAILNRLGVLRAVTFRGVTSLGSDIYVTHFANGSAEWRIGLDKDGTIGRLALGPQ